jgi:hypothetical protein
VHQIAHQTLAILHQRWVRHPPQATANHKLAAIERHRMATGARSTRCAARPIDDRALRHGTRLPRDLAALAKQDHRRDRSDIIASGNRLLRLGVELAEADPWLELFSRSFERRRQDAQKSTSSGRSDRDACASKLAAVMVIGLAENRAFLQLPQIPPAPSLSRGTRFRVAQTGQATIKPPEVWVAIILPIAAVAGRSFHLMLSDSQISA